jgi:hypothetical protein
MHSKKQKVKGFLYVGVFQREDVVFCGFEKADFDSDFDFDFDFAKTNCKQVEGMKENFNRGFQ